MTQTPEKGVSDTEIKRYCGLGNHHLRSPHRTITHGGLLKFAQNMNMELRETTPLCGTCYDVLLKTFNAKLSSQQSTAIAKRKRDEHQQPSSYKTDYDDNYDDDWGISLNAVNGTRLPNVQPIPKRRPFYHPNKDVMDIYLAGTTGG